MKKMLNNLITVLNKQPRKCSEKVLHNPK